MSKKTKRKINLQKIFCFASFIFILACIIWYGGRFTYFYLDSKKTIKEEATTLARTVKAENKGNEKFKQIMEDYYFLEDANNNYVTYSNFLWRIVKINKDNSILLISDNTIGTLAYGSIETTYNDSNLINWLNKKEDISLSGIFESILNNKEKYLIKTSTCIDTIDNIKKIDCHKQSAKNYLNLLSIEDYLYTGGDKSFINNNKLNYLSNNDKDKNIWYITADGKLDTSDGTDIIGIKPTITLKKHIDIKSGNGTKDDPYRFEDNYATIGSYVKLDEDIWRIYEEKDGIIKLVLQDAITIEDEQIKNTYSNNTYYYNDTVYNTLAYYLNNTYYKGLSYNNLIIENTYTNGFYSSDNNYNYQDISSKTIETKISIPSLGDIIFNDTTDDYFTNTGTAEESNQIYIHKSNGSANSRSVKSQNYIIPCISIEKSNLTMGTGTMNDPYRTE